MPVVKNLPAKAGNVRDPGSILGSGRPLGGGHSNPLQDSCLENPTDRGALWATVHSKESDMTEVTQHGAAQAYVYLFITLVSSKR